MSTEAERKWEGRRRIALIAFLALSGFMYVSIMWKIINYGP